MKPSREAVMAIAKALEGRAVDAHATGMAIMGRAARLKQWAEAGTDAQCTAVLDVLVHEGLANSDGLLLDNCENYLNKITN